MCGRFVADRRTVLRIPLRQLVAGDAEGVEEYERWQTERGIQLRSREMLEGLDDDFVSRRARADAIVSNYLMTEAR